MPADNLPVSSPAVGATADDRGQPSAGALLALSPIDGRYVKACSGLRDIFSEYGLIRHRLQVEVAWFKWLASIPTIRELPPLNADDEQWLDSLVSGFDLANASEIKAIEAEINHDVKAVEYFLKKQLARRPRLAPFQEFVHFACTSEDINNLSYALMLKTARTDSLLPAVRTLTKALTQLAQKTASAAMLARTHGQSASPTTMGKELAVTVERLNCSTKDFERLRLKAKFNGAVGNYNAHAIAYPELDWPAACKGFVESFDLDFNPCTTQIEPHDKIAEYCQILARLNRILVDYNRDIWGYISLGYFSQRQNAAEVGSSTMPHKINPIDFENSEGNLQLACALLSFFAAELATSRWQRDLTDSTLLRNLGVALAHSLIAWHGSLRGTRKLELSTDRLQQDLNSNWEVLAEAVQTLMRKHGLEQPYEQIKNRTRGQTLDQAGLHRLLDELDLPKDVKDRLRAITPATYTGLAEQLARSLTAD